MADVDSLQADLPAAAAASGDGDEPDVAVRAHRDVDVRPVVLLRRVGTGRNRRDRCSRSLDGARVEVPDDDLECFRVFVAAADETDAPPAPVRAPENRVVACLNRTGGPHLPGA